MNSEIMSILFTSLTGALLALLCAVLVYQQKRHQWQISYQEKKQQLSYAQQLTSTQQQELQHYKQKMDQYQQLQTEYIALKSQQEQHKVWQKRHDELYQEYQAVLSINSRQQAEIREITTLLQQTEKTTAEKIALLQDSEQRLIQQFETLANRIFANSHEHIDTQNQKSLHYLLTPLKDQLDGFKKQVQDSFGQESKERHTLTYEIRQLQQLNQQMAKEAINLTNALKGSNKIQGNWGEMVLTRILENSGLRQGIEYNLQLSLKDKQNHRLQPDVIVHLPEKKHIIIDAKMSLIAYEKYYNSGDKHIKQQALKEHLHSIRTHIKTLGDKTYHQLPGLNSLDFVLLFIPIEAALLLAIDNQPEIIHEALKQNIILTSPSTLMLSLKTVHYLWQQDNQNKNATLIAEQAAKIYDKLRLFLEDMILIGETLNKSQTIYQQAMNKISTGRGNLISQTEKFHHFGVAIKKNLPKIEPKNL